MSHYPYQTRYELDQNYSQQVRKIFN